MIDSDVNAETYEDPPEPPTPARVLILSAAADTAPDTCDGDTHALHTVLDKLWPKAQVLRSAPFRESGRRTETLGRELGRIAATRQWRSRGGNGTVPWQRWWNNASQWLLSAWSGHTLGPAVDRAAPDLILSTDPLVTAGLMWLRQQRGLAVPVGILGDDTPTAPGWHSPAGNSEDAAVEHVPPDRIEDGLRALHARTAPTPSRPLRPEDALFLHVHTEAVPQQVGTVLVFVPATAEAGPTRADVARLLRAVPGITGTLRPSGLLRRARWVPDEQCTVPSLIDEVDLVRDASDMDTAVDEFFSSPLPRTAAGGARLVTGLPDGGRAVLVKLHHALGDGITVLRGLLSGTDGAHRSWATPPVPPVGHAPRPTAGRLAHGLWNLARAGTAPSAPTARPVHNATRTHRRLTLPGDTVRKRARALDISSSELLHTLFAEAASGTFGSDEIPPRRLRMMVPWSLRGMSSVRIAGNSAGVLSTDLPVEPMPLTQRAVRVARALRDCSAGGTPEVAGAVVRSLGYLPPPLHRLANRLVYRSTWFNAIGTVLPGPRWDVRLNGTLLTTAYPVLPLAPGVGLTWGAMTWGADIAVCLTGSEALADRMDDLAEQLRTAFDELTTMTES